MSNHILSIKHENLLVKYRRQKESDLVWLRTHMHDVH
jgi:hypothetical protein